jgi:CDP-diacylglycerol--serine O-phosphatidyltransferase
LTEKRKHRGIYLLPNLFTTASLFAGFYAITAAMHGRFEAAAIAMFAAMILDGLDGRVARMTQTQTAFGGEYDSLSDMVSFGVAPALVMYEWSLHSLGKLGWLAAFVFAAAAALRLARFNTQASSEDKRYFQGLASPMAAALLAGLVWLGVDNQISGATLRVPGFLLTFVAGVLMVSNIRYRSFKDLDLKGRVPFFTLVVLMLVFAVIALDPPKVLFLIALSYAISGPVLTLLLLRNARARRKKPDEPDDSTPPAAE